MLSQPRRIPKVLDYHELHLKIVKELGDKAEEGCASGNIGNCYHSLGKFRQALERYEYHRKMATVIGDRTEREHVLTVILGTFSTVLNISKQPLPFTNFA